jgi:hypothetical protein
VSLWDGLQVSDTWSKYHLNKPKKGNRPHTPFTTAQFVESLTHALDNELNFKSVPKRNARSAGGPHPNVISPAGNGRRVE